MNLAIVLAILAIGLIFIIVLIVKDKNTFLAALLVPLLCFGVYSGWDSAQELLGHPTTIFSKDIEFIFLGAEPAPPKWIYLLVHPFNQNEPLYIKIPWTKQSARMIEDAMKMLKQGKVVAGKLGKKQENTSDGDNGQENPDIRFYDFSVRKSLPK